MKRKTTLSAIGGYQPLLFAVGMYFVALFFSIFICSAIFYAVNPRKPVAQDAPVMASDGNQGQTAGNATVLLTVTK